MLNFIQEKMLRVLPSENLKEGVGRAGCHEVVKEFQRIYDGVKALEDNQKLIATPKPRETVNLEKLEAVPVVLNPDAEDKANRRKRELRRHTGRLVASSSRKASTWDVGQTIMKWDP